MRILVSLALVLVASCSFRAAPPMAPAHSRVDLAQHRALEIERLHAYRDRGVFPVDERTGMPLSVFRDDRGRTCPMASLIDESGRGDLVDHVVATDNAMRLADVSGGPIYDWMLSSGLTREEIINIQGALTIEEYHQIMPVLPDDMREQQKQQQKEQTLQWARSEVRRKLDRILATLEEHTAESLDVAAARLVAPQVAGY